jgi:hypothetical protein
MVRDEDFAHRIREQSGENVSLTRVTSEIEIAHPRERLPRMSQGRVW